MDNDMFNINTPIVDRDLGAMTMGYSAMPYMGGGFMNPYMGTNYLNGVSMKPLAADTFDYEAYKKREKKDDKRASTIPLIIIGLLCAKPIFKGLGNLIKLIKH